MVRRGPKEAEERERRTITLWRGVRRSLARAGEVFRYVADSMNGTRLAMTLFVWLAGLIQSSTRVVSAGSDEITLVQLPLQSEPCNFFILGSLATNITPILPWLCWAAAAAMLVKIIWAYDPEEDMPVGGYIILIIVAVYFGFDWTGAWDGVSSLAGGESAPEWVSCGISG